MPHDIETLFSLIGGTQQHTLAASSSTIHTIPNQTSFKSHSYSLPRHPLRTLRYHFSLSLSKTMAATSNSLLSLTLSQSLNKPRSLSYSTTSLSLSAPRSLSLQSIHRSNSITCCSLNGPNNTNNQDIPIEKSMFSFTFLLSNSLLFTKQRVCFQKLIFDRFLQNFQRFLQSWILIRYVKSFPTGGSLSN